MVWILIFLLVGCGQIVDFDLRAELYPYQPLEIICGNIDYYCEYAQQLSSYTEFYENCDEAVAPLTDPIKKCLGFTDESCEKLIGCSSAITEIVNAE